MSYAPVAMFVYNRADHFKETYEALAKCEEAKYTDLIVFSDGAKNEKSAEGVEAVRSFANEIKNKNDFKTVKVVESPQNKGLAKSIIEGVTKVLNEYGKIIVLEDDCVCSPYFLGYMNKCLDGYENNKKIGAVSGNTAESNIRKVSKEHDLFKTAQNIVESATASFFIKYNLLKCPFTYKT